MSKHFYSIVILFWLYGCSGGISGTGDGGPVIPINGGGSTSELGPSSSADSNANANALEGTNSPTFQRYELPRSLILNIPSTLGVSPGTTDEQALLLNTLTPGIEFRQQLAASQLDVAAIRTELDLLNTETSVTLSNVSLETDLSGYFDSRLRYSRDDGSTVTVQWTADQLWVSVLAENLDSTLYSLLQSESGVMTLRRTDHSNNDTTIQLRATELTNSAEPTVTSTFIEADLNGAQQFFIRALGDATTSTIFSEPLPSGDISSRQQYREAADANGQLIVAETCSEPCTQWQTLVSLQSLPENFFSTQNDLANQRSRSLANPIELTALPQPINEFIIATGESPDTDLLNADAESIVCSGQRLAETIKTFCWQPTPLNQATFVYEESRANGVLEYRLIPQSEILIPPDTLP